MIITLRCKDKDDFNSVSKGKKIICIGGGKIFCEAYDYLSLQTREIIVIDNNKEKQENGLLINGKKIDVVRVEDLGKFLDTNVYCILITLTIANYKTIKSQIEAIFTDNMLEVYLYVTFAKGSGLIERAIDRESEILIRKKHFTKEDSIIKANERLIQYTSNDNLILPKLNVIVTERCSLRCKDCRALIQHVKKPQDESFEKIRSEIDEILDAVEAVVDVEPIGGEPLLHPEISKILQYFCDQNKILNVCITTNGMAVPNEECMKVLKNKKIHVYISDYGYLDRMVNTVCAFEKEGISFSVETDQYWFDVGDFEYRSRNNEDLKLEYLNCYCEFVLKYVWDNRIWLCPRAPRLSTLGVYESPHDYIELGKMNKTELRKEIENSFYELYADACNYCNQGDTDIGIIPAGVQVIGNQNKSRFTIIDRVDYEKLVNRI